MCRQQRILCKKKERNADCKIAEKRNKPARVCWLAVSKHAAAYLPAADKRICRLYARLFGEPIDAWMAQIVAAISTATKCGRKWIKERIL